MTNRSLLSLALVLTPPQLALAEGFGEQGTIVPGGALEFYQTRFDGPSDYGAPTVATVFSLRPELRYFVVEHWSLGLGAGGAIQDYGGGVAYELSGRLSTGYFLPLGESFGFFPEIGTAFSRSWSSTEGWQTKGVSMQLVASGHVLFHADHFFISCGPEIIKYIPVHRETNGVSVEANGSTVFGLASRIGGWF